MDRIEQKVKNYMFSKQTNFDTNANKSARLVNKNPNALAHAGGAIGSYAAGNILGGAVGSGIGSAVGLGVDALTGGTGAGTALGTYIGSSLGSIGGGVGGAYLGWKKWGRKEVDSSKYYAFKLKTDDSFDKNDMVGNKNGYDTREEAEEANPITSPNIKIKILKGSTLIQNYPALFH
jgi:hypothetical protein